LPGAFTFAHQSLCERGVNELRFVCHV
jgi:hypothetical protein